MGQKQAMKRPPKFVQRGSKVPDFKRLKDSKRYDSEWSKLSKAMLRAFPVCYCDQVKVWSSGSVITEAMAPTGTVAPAVCVDHIRPISLGGGRLDQRNLQALCHSCHSKKTTRFG